MLITRNVKLGRILQGTWKAVVITILTSVAAYFANVYIIKNLFELPAIIPSILGTALAFFIGFKNNQAYDRWWEARKIWGGLVNDSRTWARQVIYYIHSTDKINHYDIETIKKKLIYRHLAFLYALKENLRRSTEKEYHKYLSDEEINKIEVKTNKQNTILDLQMKDLNDLYKEGVIDGFQFTECNKMIVNFCDGMGKSERIRNTVFPTTYNFYTLLFIWIFIISVTIVTANLVGAWSILFGILIGYVFITTQSIGVALLDPFDNIITGTPLNQITRTIEINLLEALEEEHIPEPVQSVNGEYIM